MVGRSRDRAPLRARETSTASLSIFGMKRGALLVGIASRTSSSPSAEMISTPSAPNTILLAVLSLYDLIFGKLVGGSPTASLGLEHQTFGAVV